MNKTLPDIFKDTEDLKTSRGLEWASVESSGEESFHLISSHGTEKLTQLCRGIPETVFDGYGVAGVQ